MFCVEPVFRNQITVGEVIDPYVNVTVHDVVTSDLTLEFKTTLHSTSTIDNNGFRLVWRNEVAFHSFAVEFLGVTIAHFKLVEQDVMIDDKVAFSHLRHGYRSIQLYARCSTRTALLPGNVPRQD